ncbi:hypothetical protein D3C86_2221400 [compost metagenome]
MSVAAEADDLLADPAFDDGFQSVKSTADDEQNVGGINLDEFLMGMLPAALRRYGGNGSLQNL